ncbi:MAG: hypothetical protein QG673_555 [Pseudomonadota bacterium]|nr:hypothetical protein [Pseudomonadota bacterium]
MCEKNLHGSNDRTHITTDSRGMSINVELVLDCLKTLSSSGVSFNKEIAWHFIYLCVEPWYNHQKQSTHQIPEKTKKFLTSVLGIESGKIESVENALNNGVLELLCAYNGLKDVIGAFDSIITPQSGNKNNSNKSPNPTSDAQIFRGYSASVLTSNELDTILPGDEIYNIISEEIQLNIFPNESEVGQKDTTTD